MSDTAFTSCLVGLSLALVLTNVITLRIGFQLARLLRPLRTIRLSVITTKDPYNLAEPGQRIMGPLSLVELAKHHQYALYGGDGERITELATCRIWGAVALPGGAEEDPREGMGHLQVRLTSEQPT